MTVWGVDEPEGWLVALTWVAAAGGAALLVRRERRLGLLVAYGALQCASYLYLRPFRAHEWHLYPGLTVLGVSAWVLAVGPLVAWADARPRGRVTRILSCAGCAALFVGYAWRTVAFARAYPMDHWFGARDRTYRAAAEFLRERARPGERVAAVEVGTLGYFSDAPMYDLGGLVTRKPVIARRPPRPYTWLAVDAHYPSLEPEGESPVREWAGEFPLRLYSVR